MATHYTTEQHFDSPPSSPASYLSPVNFPALAPSTRRLDMTPRAPPPPSPPSYLSPVNFPALPPSTRRLDLTPRAPIARSHLAHSQIAWNKHASLPPVSVSNPEPFCSPPTPPSPYPRCADPTCPLKVRHPAKVYRSDSEDLPRQIKKMIYLYEVYADTGREKGRKAIGEKMLVFFYVHSEKVEEVVRRGRVRREDVLRGLAKRHPEGKKEEEKEEVEPWNGWKTDRMLTVEIDEEEEERRRMEVRRFRVDPEILKALEKRGL